MSHLLIPRKIPGAPKPPWWQPWASNHTQLCCPDGHIALLDHEIDSKGRVTTSVECPGPKCTWHVNVTLEGWRG